jgi:hypothetical protein
MSELPALGFCPARQWRAGKNATFENDAGCLSLEVNPEDTADWIRQSPERSHDRLMAFSRIV